MRGERGMRDRLIEIFKKTDYSIFPNTTANANLANQFSEHALNDIVDKLLENGVIVPPCKVGDKVWFVERRFHYNLKTFREFVCEGYVKAIKVSMKPMKITIEYPIADDPKARCKGADWSAGSIGKTVFLTREEAEQALKEGAE